MHVRTRWPWISLLLGAVVALNPIGLDFLHSAFLSGEQLSRNIAQPIVFSGLAILVALPDGAQAIFVVPTHRKGPALRISVSGAAKQ